MIVMMIKCIMIFNDDPMHHDCDDDLVHHDCDDDQIYYRGSDVSRVIDNSK